MRAAILGTILSVAVGNGGAQTVIHERIILDSSAPEVGAAPESGPLFSVDSVNVGIKYYKIIRVNTPVDTVVSSRLQMSMAVPSGYGPLTFMVTDFPVGLGTILWQRTLQGGQQSVVDTTFANRSMLLLVGHAVETDGSFNHVCPQSINISLGGDTAYLHIEASDPNYETFTALITVTLPTVCVEPERYSQANPLWGGDSYDGCIDTTISQLGCALSCMAMAMTAFGDTVHPGQLNAWMKDQPSPSLGGYTGKAVTWSAASALHSGQLVNATRLGSCLAFKKLPDGSRVILDSTNVSSSNVLDSLLSLCELVAVQVKSKGANRTHWILVYKKAGEQYLVRDPGFSSTQYLSEYGMFWGYVAFRRTR